MLVLHALALDEERLLESSSQEDRDIPPQGKVKEEGALSSAEKPNSALLSSE